MCLSVYACDTVSVHHTGGTVGIPSRTQPNLHAECQGISLKITAESMAGHKALSLWPAGTRLVNVPSADKPHVCKTRALRRISSSFPGPVPFCRADGRVFKSFPLTRVL